jgi:predicted HTH domain antitoxin
MKIEIDDEMLAVVEAFEKNMSGPVSLENAEEYAELRTDILAKLLSKINTEKMYQRVTS